jgi:hypothetical protein
MSRVRTPPTRKLPVSTFSKQHSAASLRSATTAVSTAEPEPRLLPIRVRTRLLGLVTPPLFFFDNSKTVMTFVVKLEQKWPNLGIFVLFQDFSHVPSNRF